MCTVCVFSWGPRSILVRRYGSSPQVKRLAQIGPATAAPALFAALSSFTVTYSWSGQMVPTEVAVIALQVLDVRVLL